MESSDVNNYGLPLSGFVVRVVAPAKRSNYVEEIFLLAADLDSSNSGDFATRFVRGGTLADTCAFRTEPGSRADVIYSRAVDSGAQSESLPRSVTVQGIPQADLVDDSPMDEDEFFGVLHATGRVPLEEGAVGLARRLAATLDQDKVRPFWARKEELIAELGRAGSRFQPGTDSHLYWALAVILGPRAWIESARAGGTVEVSDAAVEASEAFTALPEDVFYLQTDQRLAFLRPPQPPLLGEQDLVSGGVMPRHLFGFHLRAVTREATHVACAGLVSAPAPETDQGVEAMIRALAASRGLRGLSNLVWASTGTESGFAGLEFVSFVTPWKGTVHDYLRSAG